MDNVEDFFMSENDESSDNKEDSENEVNLKLTRKRRSITQPIVPLKENSANIKDNKKKDEGGKKGNRKVSIQTISSPTEFENSLLDPSIFDSTNSLDQSTSPNPPPKLNENQTEKTSQKQKGSKIDVVKDKGEKKTVSKGVPVKLTEKEKEISNLLERSSNKDSDDNEDILDDSKKEEEEEGEKKLSRKELRRLKNGEINKPIRDRKISISLSAFLDDPPADNLDQSEAGGQGYDDMIDNIIDFSEDRVDDIEEAVNAKSSKSSARTSKPSSKEQSDDDDNRVNQKNKTKENKTMQKKKEETVKGKKNSNNLHYFEPPESPFPHSTRDTVAPLNDIDFENDDEIENEDDHHKRPVNNKLKSNKIKENKENATKKAKAAKKIEVNKERKRGGKKEYDNNVNYAADDSVLNDEDDSVLLENRLAEEEDSDFTEGNISKRIDDEEELSDYENDITKDEFSVLQSDPALSTPKNLSLSQLANYKVDLNNKTTTELKSELKKMKLETSGNKGQLIDRILDNLSSQPSSSPGRSPFHSSTSSSHTLKSPKYQTPNRKYPKRKTRITPLEYWKNERVVYSRNKSGLKIIKEEEDDEDHSVKASQPKKKQKVEPLILSESQVYNIQTKSYLPFGNFFIFQSLFKVY